MDQRWKFNVLSSLRLDETTDPLATPLLSSFEIPYRILTGFGELEVSDTVQTAENIYLRLEGMNEIFLELNFPIRIIIPRGVWILWNQVAAWYSQKSYHENRSRRMTSSFHLTIGIPKIPTQRMCVIVVTGDDWKNTRVCNKWLSGGRSISKWHVKWKVINC